MLRLRGSDAFAIYSETPTSPFVTLKVAIYRPACKDDVPDIVEIRRFLEAGIATHGGKCPHLRIVRVPFDLHHPVWVADRDFSPDDHIYHIALPPPGRKAQLCDFLSDLMGMPLNPERPLWEIWVVEGLEDGRIAIVSRLHHALADGSMVAAMIGKTHGSAVRGQVPTAGFGGEPLPGKSRLLRDALVDLCRSFTIELPHFYRQFQQARQGDRAVENAAESVATSSAVPFTIFNKFGGRYRIFRYETFSLAEFRALSRRFDCTVNTLIMGVCSEALRRYLLEVDALPSLSLASGMPIGDPGGGDSDTLLGSDIHNNRLAGVAIVPLYQDIADFGQRLQAIKRASKAAVASVRRSRSRRLETYLDFLPGAFIRLMFAVLYRRVAQEKEPFANLVISNVSGPGKTLYALDGRLEMVELLSVGNLTDGGNLNITVWSYVDNLSFSFYTRKGALPEPDRINAHVTEVVGELRGQYLAERPLSGSDQLAPLKSVPS